MFTCKVNYEDFDGNKREEECMFSLKQTEWVEFDTKYEGGIQGELGRIAATANRSKLISLIQDLVLASYGQKSLDGRRFIKDENSTTAFKESCAFDEVVIKIVSDDTGDGLIKFITGILPNGMANEVTKTINMKKLEMAATGNAEA